MILTDTHTHLYSEQFNEDIDTVIQNSINKGITRLFLLKRFKDKPNHNLQNISSGYKRNIKASSSYSPYELKLIDALRMRTGEDRGTFVRRIVCLYLQDLLTIIE